MLSVTTAFSQDKISMYNIYPSKYHQNSSINNFFETEIIKKHEVSILAVKDFKYILINEPNINYVNLLDFKDQTCNSLEYSKRDLNKGIRKEVNDFSEIDKIEKKKKKWPYYVAGGAVVGGIIVYLITRSPGEKEETPTTGSITIDIPVQF